MQATPAPLGDCLKKLVEGEHLTSAEAEAAMECVMAGGATQAQIAAMLVALRMKGERPEEIAGFARAMRRNVLRVSVSVPDAVDVVGTGGDVLKTFNISTAAAFVAAAGGVPVAKHGNRAVTSRCGAADVLEALGLPLDLTPEQLGKCIDDVGIGFLFAAALHPAMRHAAPVRRELRLRTVFNLLGPLTNPAGARRQVLGVFSEAWVRPVAEALLELGTDHTLVFHGLDGLDELSTLGPTAVAEVREGRVEEYTVTPEDLGLARARPEDLAGGDAGACAAVMVGVLGGQAGPRQDIVALNAGAALYVGGKAASLAEGLASAQSVLAAGGGLRKLEELRDYAAALKDAAAGGGG